MSKEFIRERFGSRHLSKAREQQKQLQYFTQSDVQEDISLEYLEKWVHRKYRTDDYFLNFVKTIFKTENFLSFFKYLRFPSPSAGLINDSIVPALRRVFFSEDSYFKYVIKGKEVDEPEELNCKKFNEVIFQAILFRHNDILIHDLEGINTPFRKIISIKNVVAIDSEDSIINRIAYTAEVVINGEKVDGYIYMDKFVFAFYDKKQFDGKRAELPEEPIFETPHDLGECPADYLTPHAFKDDDPVRKGLFSYVREKLEEFVFLKTLQKMTEPNSAIPVVAKLKTTENKKDQTTITEIDFPLSSASLKGGATPSPPSSPNQAGTIVEVPMVKKDDGSIDMEVVKNFFNYYHAPVDILKFINERVIQIENDIMTRMVGDFKQQNEDARNELDVRKGYVGMEDRLRVVSDILTRIRNLSDYKFLALKYGPGAVMVDAFYGSDFFLETEQDLYDRFEKAPNTIERKNILVKLSSTRNRFNRERTKREAILYDLIPFVSDKDFATASAREGMDDITFQYQTRFTYWIGLFEATYGDIVEFWDAMESTDSEKLILINNLVTNFIKDYAKESKTDSDPEDDQVSPST